MNKLTRDEKRALQQAVAKQMLGQVQSMRNVQEALFELAELNGHTDVRRQFPNLNGKGLTELLGETLRTRGVVRLFDGEFRRAIGVELNSEYAEMAP